MRAPIDVMTSATCADFSGRSPPWGAADDLAAQGSELEQNLAGSYAKWRENAAQKQRENEELQRSRMGKNTPELVHLRQVFLEGTAKKRAESQSKAKQEQPPPRLPVNSLQSATVKHDPNYPQHHPPAPLPTAPLTHFDDTGKVSPRVRARPQDRKRKLPSTDDGQQSWITPATFHYGAPPACMQPPYFAVHSQQMSFANGNAIGPTDNISEDSLHHLMANNSDSNFHSVNLEDIDRVLFDAERTDPRLLLEAKQQDDHLPLGASSSSLQYEAAMQQQQQQLHQQQQQQQHGQQLQLQQHDGLRLPHMTAQQQHAYGMMPASSSCTLPTMQQRLPPISGAPLNSLNYPHPRAPMVQQPFSVNSSSYLPPPYANYGHPPAATVRWGPPDLRSNLPFNPEPNAPHHPPHIRPSYPASFGYAQRLQ